MSIFSTTQSDYMHLNGLKIIDKQPLDVEKYDFDEVDLMWEIKLENGEAIQCFNDEIS